MKYQAFVRAAAGVLSVAALSTAAVVVQAQGAGPQPATMVDTEPLPASERNSLGAVIMMDEPVLAQREAMQQMAARAPDTRSMGAGPARILQNSPRAEQDELKKQLERANIPTK